MKKAITLKHLTPYLSYGLKGYFFKEIDIVHEVELEHSLISGLNCNTIELKNFKPILRPLSDLTKDVNNNGITLIEKIWRTVYNDEGYYVKKVHEGVNHFKVTFRWKQFDDINDDEVEVRTISKDIKLNPYWIADKLFKYHFDVFGLIEKGLAIDINSLKNS